MTLRHKTLRQNLATRGRVAVALGLLLGTAISSGVNGHVLPAVSSGIGAVLAAITYFVLYRDTERLGRERRIAREERP